MIFGICWNESGDHLLSTSDDRTVRLWSYIWKVPENTPDNIGYEISSSIQFEGHQARVWRSKWLPDYKNLNAVASDVPPRYFASCSEDTTCRIWDLSTGNCVGVYNGHSGKNLWGFAVHPTHPYIISSGADCAIKVISSLIIYLSFINVILGLVGRSHHG